MSVEIRPVRPEEHEKAGRVTALAYREFADSDDWDHYLGKIADVGARASMALVLVAVEDGEVLGSATLELGERIDDDDPPLAPDEAHIRMLGVDPEARGRGVARALIGACFAPGELRRGDAMRQGALQQVFPRDAHPRRVPRTLGLRSRLRVGRARRHGNRRHARRCTRGVQGLAHVGSRQRLEVLAECDPLALVR